MKEGDKIRLSVSDNGVGLPPGIDLTRSDTLGLKIVNALATQLAGNHNRGARGRHRGDGGVLTAMKALLFDIDGTLVRCHGAGISALMEAARETYGTFGTMDRIDFQGSTDPIIIRESLSGNGLDEAALARGLPRMKELYFERLARNIASTGVEVLPGVEELLEKLSGCSGIILGLLTGNYEEGARIKLSTRSLFERFSFGVFGDDAAVRNDLPAVAKDRLLLKVQSRPAVPRYYHNRRHGPRHRLRETRRCRVGGRGNGMGRPGGPPVAGAGLLFRRPRGLEEFY